MEDKRHDPLRVGLLPGDGPHGLGMNVSGYVQAVLMPDTQGQLDRIEALLKRLLAERPNDG